MNKLVLFFSSVFGTGYIKYAPGTFGTLAGLLLWVLFIPDNYTLHLLAIISIFIVSVFLSSAAEKIYSKKDDQRIVIDEVAGIWVAVAFLPKTVLFLGLGFILFRFFDIKKPWFIRKSQKIKGGFGITADDILAGLFANIILQALHIFIK
ncbi:MAG: phosphatidylglycerophosphatase A [Endomicrobia bacterium]|nr:phosphatidylglycerophosphatase A [Endomicrobiia bacterium]MCL2507134.1 phosphatidylglycerophosphatase A [Endomicrobiia bacterium]